MKFNIRKSIFETNSSSMHSLTVGVCKDHTADEDERSTFTLGEGEYDWDYERLDYWLEKADYFAIEAKNNNTKKDLLFNVLKKKYPNSNFKLNPKKDELGYEDGYIDHQSIGKIWNYILNTKNPEKKLYNIIFGDSEIIIDNDNH